MNNADMPAKPARILNPEIAQLLRENREKLSLSVQEIRNLASLSPGFTKFEELSKTFMHACRVDRDSHYRSRRGMASEACDMAEALLKEWEERK